MSLSSALLAHYAGTTTTLCTLVTITRLDGVTLGYTDHDTDLHYAGITYLAGTYSPSSIVSTADMAVDNLEITAVLNDTLISRADLLAGTWNYAAVQIEQANYKDLSAGTRILRKGHLGAITINASTVQAEFRGLSQGLQQTIGEVSTALCRADLGDARCGIDLAALTVTGTVSSIEPDNRTLTDPARTEPGPAGSLAIGNITQARYAVVTVSSTASLTAGQTVLLSDIVGMTVPRRIKGQLGYSLASLNGTYAAIRSISDGTHLVLDLDTRSLSPYLSGGQLNFPQSVGTFDGGKITFTSGTNLGHSMEIKSYVPGLLILALPMPYTIAVGDTYSLIPGCAKRILEDCHDRYGNVPNFRGEPYRPGLDELLKSGGA